MDSLFQCIFEVQPTTHVFRNYCKKQGKFSRDSTRVTQCTVREGKERLGIFIELINFMNDFMNFYHFSKFKKK